MEDDDFAHAPLTGGRSTRFTSKIMSGLVIAILVFSFFAFVFATASFAAAKNLKSGVSNNFYNQQGGLIQETYAVAAGTRNFGAGTVMSYCDNNSPSGVCPGLGPVWNETVYPKGSLVAATIGDLKQISPDLAVYAWVVPSAPNVLRIAAIRTSAYPVEYTANPTLLTLSYPISWIALRAFSPTGVVVAYTSDNSSYIVAAAVPLTAAIQFGTPLNMFEVTLTTDGFPIDVLVLNSAYVLVSYGPNSNGAAFLAYTVDGTTLNPLNVAKNALGFQITNAIASVDLGSGYFLYATGNMAVLGTYILAGNTLTLSSQKTLAFTNVLYESITATSLFNGYIALAGVQTELLQVALTVSMVLQWSTTPPYINAFFPNNLLESQGHQLVNNQLSTCYAPSSSGEPKGELFFSYVDSISDRGKIIRAKIAVTTNQDVQILPSPPIDISTFTYTQFGTSLGPLVACPSSSGVLVAIQYLGTYMNTFVWEGGYRFAGIAQESYEAGSSKTGVKVMRQGISDVHEQLQPGFPYYINNYGHLHAHASIVEMFSSASFNTPVGVALTDKQLLLDTNVFERISHEGGGN